MLFWQDVNLDTLEISGDGPSILIRMADMVQGDALGSLLCADCFHFSMQNIFQEDDGFACYAGEVRCDLYEDAAIYDLLERQGFPFSGYNGERVLPDAATVFWIHIEGGKW